MQTCFAQRLVEIPVDVGFNSLATCQMLFYCRMILQPAGHLDLQLFTVRFCPMESAQVPNTHVEMHRAARG